MRKLSGGAEAELYEDSVVGLRAVLKRRSEKSYRVRELDQRIRLSRTRTEARVMGRAAKLIRCPAVLMVGRYDLWLERIEGATLNVLVERGSLSKVRLRTLAGRAGSYLGKLHRNGIVHGDYTSANLMLDGEGLLWVIDFGLAVESSASEEMALDVLLMKRSIPADAFASFENGYRSVFSGSNTVLGKLREIERRGRYQTRSLQTA
jgi:TP53 regulating kinase-like protein